MEFLSFGKDLETAMQAFVSVAKALILIARFLFLTLWGWLIIVAALISIIVAKSRNKNGEITAGGFLGSLAEVFFWFYSHMTSVLIGIILLFSVTFVYNTVKDLSYSLNLFREVKTLEAALKNLKAERKLLEVNASLVTDKDTAKINVRMKYFAYSPVKDEDIFTGEAVYSIEGKKLFVDFGTINFDYSLVEKGLAKNITFPNKIYSDSVSYENGMSIFAQSEGMPLSFKLDNQELYLMKQPDYKKEILEILSAFSSPEKARSLGLRAAYGEALSVYPAATARTVSFYSTATGGIIMK